MSPGGGGQRPARAKAVRGSLRGMVPVLVSTLVGCASPDVSLPDGSEAAPLDVLAKADTASWTPCPASPCRVMPLGDSITDGYNVPGGYRIRLEDLALADGHGIDFVGGLRNGPVDLLDQDHEGHSGWRIDQVQSIIGARMTVFAPDIVLLHIGTNDIAQNYALGGAGTRLARLVNTITALNPDALVVVSTIIPASSGIYEARIGRYNTVLSSVVTSLQAGGAHVTQVDLHAALTTADLADGVHPTQTGYEKMADGWYPAIEPWLP